MKEADFINLEMKQPCALQGEKQEGLDFKFDQQNKCKINIKPQIL